MTSSVQWVQLGDVMTATVRWIHVGEPIQTMLTPDGYRVWIGTGAPHIVSGATAGDLYLDTDTGMLYRLD